MAGLGPIPKRYENDGLIGETDQAVFRFGATAPPLALAGETCRATCRR